MSSGRLRRRAVWVLLVPFLWFARPTTATLTLGSVLMIGGLVIRGWAAGQLQKNKELTVSGPYAHTRNPLYLGSLLIGLGVTAAGGLPIFALIFSVFFLLVYKRTMDLERRYLSDRFGEQYDRYQESVPLFFPRLQPYSPPPEFGHTATRFSLDRYVKNKEWEAALGAVLGLGFLAAKAGGAF